MQKSYWTKNCHKVGYAPRSNIKHVEPTVNESSPEVRHLQLSRHPKGGAFSNKVSKDSSKYKNSVKPLSTATNKAKDISSTESTKGGTTSTSMENGTKSSEKHGKSRRSHLRIHDFPCEPNESDSESENLRIKGDTSVSSVPNAFPSRKSSDKEINLSELLTTSPSSLKFSGEGVDGISTRSQTKAASALPKENVQSSEVHLLKIKQLEDENDALKQSVKTIQESMSHELQQERSKNKLLLVQLEEKEKLLDEANKEQEALIDIFSEERNRRDEEVATLRKRLKNAHGEIHDLQDKLAKTTR